MALLKEDTLLIDCKCSGKSWLEIEVLGELQKCNNKKGENHCATAWNFFC